MADRTDIDALLIGALYGELTPADEARLAAHLESHPADRSALADLTHTRDAVRASRVLDVQREPPQSVSALLMQEAARRLPRTEPDRDGWFYRFTRAVMGRPAMAAIAAAAMFVLVIGVAGTLYLKRVPQFAETSAPPAASSNAAVPSSTLAGSSPEAAPPAASEAAAGSAAPAPAAPAPAAQPDSYRVGLDDARPTAVEQQRAQLARESAKGMLDDAEMRRAKLEAAAEPKAVPAKAKLQKKSAGIVVSTPELKPRELEDDVAPAGRKIAAPEPWRDDDASPRAGDRTAASKPARPTTGGFAAPPRPAAPGAPPQKQPAAPPANESITIAGGAVAPSPPPAPAPRPAPAQVTDGRFATRSEPAAKDARSAEDKASEDAALLAWARRQHEQVKAFVKSSNCVGAATVAGGIYGRAPDYYTANVATDRDLKPCMAYLNREREREDRSRAAKRALSTDAPAPTLKK